MAKGNFKLGASSKAIDPALDALFSTSAGPAKPHAKSKYSEAPPPRDDDSAEEDSEEADVDVEDDEDESMDDAEEASDDDDDEIPVHESVAIEQQIKGSNKKTKERKRKREEADDLEDRYLKKLAQEEEADEIKEKQKEKRENEKKKPAAEGDEDDTSSEGTSSSGDDEDDKDDKKEDAMSESDDDEIPIHESVVAAKAKEAGKATPKEETDLDKANRTVFLANVAAEASSSKTSRRTLLNHLSTILSPGEKIESIRFRSLAFSTSAMPKRAAYITSSLMDATTKATNAYAVYPTQALARKACEELNGTVVLDRHLRVDSVAHPTPTDHKRCVFVGNLGFVDDETVINTNSAGETTTKKRTKVPGDIEEGLWRTFSKHAGKVENVRVVRDSKTRVGKGFAYVQFYDGNGVEAALLLNEKKFPPMLPRTLRVVRAKAPHKTALAMERKTKAKAAAEAAAAAAAKASEDADGKSTKYKHKATPEEQSMAGRAAKLLGRSAAIREQKGGKKGGKRVQGNGSGIIPKSPEDIIFEGRRASANDGRPNDVKLGGKKRKGSGVQKAKGRGAKRAQEWRKKGQGKA